MPVMVFYKEKQIPTEIATKISEEIAQATKSLLNAAIEVRIIEPLATFNANEIHIEMQFRDFNEWDARQLEKYHNEIMELIGKILKNNTLHCSYSFYIVPSNPPKSIWAQNKV